MREVILASGASAYGLTHALKQYECPRRAYLSTGAPDVPTPNLARGIIAHALMDAWHRFELEASDIPTAALAPANHPALADVGSIQDARRLVEWVTSVAFQGRRDGLGTVLGSELDFESEALATSLGSPHALVTGRIDLLLNVEEQHLAAWANLAGGGVAVMPGPWIVDYKFVDRRFALNKYALDLHSSLYPLLVDTTPSRCAPVMGVIYLFGVNTKAVGAEVVVQPREHYGPDMLRRFYSLLCAKLELDGGAVADPTACVSAFGQVCPFQAAGCWRF